MKSWSRIIVPSLGLLFELMGNPIYLRVLFLKHSLYLIYIFRSDFCYITLTNFVFEVDALFERSNQSSLLKFLLNHLNCLKILVFDSLLPQV